LHDVTLRAATAQDAPLLQEIELATHEQFREVGHPEAADDGADPLDVLISYAAARRSWVAVDRADRPIGYVLVDIVDGSAHISQVTVRPDCQGKGTGRLLVERVKGFARDNGLRAITLTTYSDVPWNRPLYEHLGFEVLVEADIGAELRDIRFQEADRGFGPEGRVAMRLDIF